MPLSKEEFLYYLKTGFIISDTDINIEDLMHQIDNDYSAKVIKIHYLNYYYVYVKKTINNTNLTLSDNFRSFNEDDVDLAEEYKVYLENIYRI